MRGRTGAARGRPAMARMTWRWPVRADAVENVCTSEMSESGAARAAGPTRRTRCRRPLSWPWPAGGARRCAVRLRWPARLRAPGPRLSVYHNCVVRRFTGACSNCTLIVSNRCSELVPPYETVTVLAHDTVGGHAQYQDAESSPTTLRRTLAMMLS